MLLHECRNVQMFIRQSIFKLTKDVTYSVGYSIVCIYLFIFRIRQLAMTHPIHVRSNSHSTTIWLISCQLFTRMPYYYLIFSSLCDFARNRRGTHRISLEQLATIFRIYEPSHVFSSSDFHPSGRAMYMIRFFIATQQTA